MSSNENQFHILGGNDKKNEGQDQQPSNQQQQSKPAQEGEFRVQPEPQDISSDFSVYHATPGPAIPKNFDAQKEGSKEDRRAQAAEWNKK